MLYVFLSYTIAIERAPPKNINIIAELYESAWNNRAKSVQASFIYPLLPIADKELKIHTKNMLRQENSYLVVYHRSGYTSIISTIICVCQFPFEFHY